MTVRIFVDYQNVHLSVAEAFAPPGTPPVKTLVHPGKFADALMARRSALHRDGEVDEIHVYRGQPSSEHEASMAGRNKAQAAEWTRDRRVKMHSRPLRYPRDWPNNRAREKGIDVALAIDLVRCAIDPGDVDTIILASRDTDLVPALEVTVELGKVEVEVVTWQGCSRLRLPGQGSRLWCTYLQGPDYIDSKDPRPY